MDRGIKVGLGTDVSGGFRHGILNAIRDASIASKIWSMSRAQPRPSEHHRFADSHLPLATLFYLATLGGARVCCLEDKIGSFRVGKSFDALLVQTGSPGDADDHTPLLPPVAVKRAPAYKLDSNPAYFAHEGDTAEKRLEKCKQAYCKKPCPSSKLTTLFGAVIFTVGTATTTSSTKYL